MKHLRLLLPLLLLAACNKEPELPEEKENPELAPTTVITLPVIFHVLHNGDLSGNGSNVEGWRIQRLLDSANSRFAGRNSGGANTYIQFRLATKNEGGELLAEPGINRINTGIDKVNFDSIWLDNTWMRDEIWAPDQYINVFLVNSYPSWLGGFATLPYQTSTRPISGLPQTPTTNWAQTRFRQGLYLRSDLLRAPSSQYHKTFVHELGHYFGLFHPFSEDSCVVNADYCSDTHDYHRTNATTSYFRTGCDGVSYRSINYMDYDPVDRTEFTPEQIVRMRYVCNYAPWRGKLLHSQARRGQPQATTQVSMPWPITLH